jgi:hypothetical protein
VARYLSLAWIDELTAAVAKDTGVQAAAVGHRLGVTQVVTDGPEGTVIYHLQVQHDAVHFGPGPAEAEDARFDQSWTTAVGVATGTLAAQEAFLKGFIKLSGDKDKLVKAQPVLAALEPIFARVRDVTEYA